MTLSKPLLSTQATRRRWVGLGVLALAALAAHLLLFSGLEWAWPQRRPTAAPAAAVQLRVVDEAPMAAALPVGTEPAPVAAPTPARAVSTRPRAVVASPAVAAPEPAVLLPTAASVAPPSVASDTVPVYRTELPPALALRYVMQRGALRGTAELSWRPAADHYMLRLQAQVAGLTLLTQVSTGGFDAAGLAPLRFTDQRVRRGTKAANFQREAGKITFSGPSTEFALSDGAQDRLSWMVQLGAIVAAEPGLRAAGSKVVLVVVGANGDAGVWAFDCLGVEPVATGAGSVDALKFVREPREPYDTQVQVWLDAAQHYFPVRATQKSGPDDEGFELRLQSAGEPP